MIAMAGIETVLMGVGASVLSNSVTVLYSVNVERIVVVVVSDSPVIVGTALSGRLIKHQTNTWLHTR